MKSITYLAPHRTALTMSVVFAVFSLVLIVPMLLIMSLIPSGGQEMGAGPLLGMMLIMPVIHFIMGYLSTAVFALIYNFLARYTGGITFRMSE